MVDWGNILPISVDLYYRGADPLIKMLLFCFGAAVGLIDERFFGLARLGAHTAPRNGWAMFIRRKPTNAYLDAKCTKIQNRICEEIAKLTHGNDVTEPPPTS